MLRVGQKPYTCMHRIFGDLTATITVHTPYKYGSGQPLLCFSYKYSTRNQCAVARIHSRQSTHPNLTSRLCNLIHPHSGPCNTTGISVAAPHLGWTWMPWWCLQLFRCHTRDCTYSRPWAAGLGTKKQRHAHKSTIYMCVNHFTHTHTHKHMCVCPYTHNNTHVRVASSMRFHFEDNKQVTQVACVTHFTHTRTCVWPHLCAFILRTDKTSNISSVWHGLK